MATRLVEMLGTVEGRLFGFQPPSIVTGTSDARLAQVPEAGVSFSLNRLEQTIRRAVNLTANISERL